MTNNVQRCVLVAAMLLASGIGCTGPTGPAGRQGSTGDAGPQGPKGDTGAPGTPAVDSGSISGMVKNAAGSPIADVSITTNPATQTVQSNATGAFMLASIPIGSYEVVASKTGYAKAEVLVGVAAGATVAVSLSLAVSDNAPGVLSGVVSGPGSAVSAKPIAGASVCFEGVTPAQCTTTASDGTYVLSGVAPGFVFVTASADGFLPGENRRAANLPAGGTAKLDVALSGRPPSTATFIGSNACLVCHTALTRDVVTAWKASAHNTYTEVNLNHIDTTGWPDAPSGTSCAIPAAKNTGVIADDPSGKSASVWLLRYPASCNPQYAMTFGSSTAVDPSAIVMPIDGTVGGASTGAGQCGHTGMIPATATCEKSWWQQEYLVKIGPHTSGWVNWTITGNLPDMMVLPAAWNGRQHAWANASDYEPTRSGTFSQVCTGCHTAGAMLATDGSGIVTSFGVQSEDSNKLLEIGCEKCHGPGSAHAAAGDAKLIVDPKYLLAQSANETCGQCHMNGGTSASPAGAFDFAWNDQASFGGGNFIPGVDKLSDYLNLPAFGDPSLYVHGFATDDHTQFQDLQGSPHANNNVEKVTCNACHDPHSLNGGPSQIERVDEGTGKSYVLTDNTAAFRDDVMCLSCHATHGDFASVTLSDVALYHESMGGAAQEDGKAPSGDAAKAQTDVATAVTAHMLTRAGMPAYFDPTGATSGAPVGRCTTCHMPMTSATGTFFPAFDAMGRRANQVGDVASHTFLVAGPDVSLATYSAATSWDEVMPNSCGACHAAYRFGK